MENYLEIFDVLFEIKDNITDYQFLFLNEKVGELYKLAKENKKLDVYEIETEEEEDEEDEEEDWETEEEEDTTEIIRVAYPQNQRIIIEHSDSESELDSDDDDFSIEEEDEQEIVNHEDFVQCCKSLETLKLYKNFDEFIEINPILGNLYREAEVEIQKEPIFDDYDRDYFVRNLRNLVKLEHTLNEKNRVYCILSMYNFLMKNAQCVKENLNLGKILLIKFEKYENNVYLLELLNGMDIKSWLQSFKNILI